MESVQPRSASLDAREFQREAHKALDRMRRAERRGTGCYLTAEMISSLSITFIGEVWADENPFSAEDA